MRHLPNNGVFVLRAHVMRFSGFDFESSYMLLLLLLVSCWTDQLLWVPVPDRHHSASGTPVLACMASNNKLLAQ